MLRCFIGVKSPQLLSQHIFCIQKNEEIHERRIHVIIHFYITQVPEDIECQENGFIDLRWQSNYS